MVLEKKTQLGLIPLKCELGFCGHPGLTEEVSRYPIAKEGTYRVSIREDDLDECTSIEIVSIEEEILNPARQNRETAVCIGTHGGIILGESSEIFSLQKCFETACDAPGDKLWNTVADGICDRKIQSLAIPNSAAEFSFAFVACNEYCAVTPLLAKNGETAGYRIECNLNDLGEKEPRPEHIKQLDRLETPTVEVNEKGWTRCPYCEVKFKPTDQNAWTGFRHRACLHLLNLKKT